MKEWLKAFRLRTLPLAFSSIFMGAFLAHKEGLFNLQILVLCLLTTLFLQVLSNLANDYGDSIHGADSIDREGPKRAVQSGTISLAQMKMAIVIFSVFSFLSGVILLYLAFGLNNLLSVFVWLCVGLCCIAAAIKYTAGKNPYGYAGLGDVAVFLFFGIIGVCGTYYMFTQQFTAELLLPAIACGVFATGVLNVNNIRDIDSDEKAGKRSIPVRLGRAKAIKYHWGLLAGGMISSVLYIQLYGTTLGWNKYILLFSFPLFIWNGIAISTKSTAAQIDPYLKQLAISTLFFVIVFGLSL